MRAVGFKRKKWKLINFYDLDLVSRTCIYDSFYSNETIKSLGVSCSVHFVPFRL